MPFDGEPKDGDFVRYIEMLDRQAGGTPGAVPKRERGGTKLKLPLPGWSTHETPQPAARPLPSPDARSGATVPSSGATRAEAGQPTDTLAARGGQRHLSLALSIAALVALWSAMQKLFFAIDTGTLDLDALVPVIFLLVCAGMLFKGAHSAGKKSRQPVSPLSPLNNVQMGRNPKD